MQAIAKVQTDNREVNQLQSNILSYLNTIGQNALLSGVILANQSLKSGDNTINTKLNRKLQGWFIIRQRGPATLYDKQDSNQTPNSTLILNSSANVSVDIFVF
jgi:hypothetical protein